MDSSSAGAQGASAGRVYTAARYALELDGKVMGYIKSVDGGGITADVIGEQVGADYFTHKHIGQPKYEEFNVDLDFSLDAAFYACISNAWTGKASRDDYSVYTLDANNKVVRQDQYFNALITEVTFPKLDGSSKDSAYMTVKFAPEYSRSKKGSGKLNVPAGKGGPKKWLASNFRFEMGALPCDFVSQIDAFTVVQAVTRDMTGAQRGNLIEPGKIEFPNLTIAISEAHAAEWQGWFDDFVVKGNNGDDREKNGSLAFLSADKQTVLAQVNFFNVGIFSLAPEPAEAGVETVRRLRAGLYLERMEFVLA
jgi:hypothetical protein